MAGLGRVSRFIASDGIFIRSVYAETLLEDFLISAIASVLAIRLYLRLTGYPMLAPNGLHIAHVLWGGLLMLIALVILLAFLNRSAQELGAVIGGVGFGAFIDELGKFITNDNNYFYEPTVAFIYITFVLLYFSIRAISRYQSLSREECFANAFEIAKQANIVGLDPEEQQLALKMLEQCGETGAVGEKLRAILLTIETASANHSLLTRLRQLLDKFYEYVAAKWWFSGMVIAFFAFTSITSLYALVATVQWSWALVLWVLAASFILLALFHSRRTHIRYLNALVSAGILAVSILLTWAVLGNLKQEPLSLIDLAQFIFPAISGILVFIGVVLLPSSRVRAYRMFRRSILISIFFTQVLAFYADQLFALIGLLLNILILLGLRYMINHEELKLKEEASPMLASTV